MEESPPSHFSTSPLVCGYWYFENNNSSRLFVLLDPLEELINLSRRKGTPILGYGREVPQWWTPFLRFSIQLGSYFMPHHNLIGPLFRQKKKIAFSLSHLVPEILGVIFHQIVLFKILLDFQSNRPPFSLILDLFDPSFLQNLRFDWVQFFLSRAEPDYQKFGEVPPPSPHGPEQLIKYIHFCFSWGCGGWRDVYPCGIQWPRVVLEPLDTVWGGEWLPRQGHLLPHEERATTIHQRTQNT